jgi:hypothetical protein
LLTVLNVERRADIQLGRRAETSAPPTKTSFIILNNIELRISILATLPENDLLILNGLNGLWTVDRKPAMGYLSLECSALPPSVSPEAMPRCKGHDSRWAYLSTFPGDPLQRGEVIGAVRSSSKS